MTFFNKTYKGILTNVLDEAFEKFPSTSSCVSSVVVNRNGSAFSGSGVCSGHLYQLGTRSSRWFVKAPLVLIQRAGSGYMKDTLNSPLAIQYLTWLLNHSPWAHVYLEKDVDFALRNGLAMDTEVPSNLMLVATITFRHALEFKDKLETWKALVDLGVDPTVALIINYVCRIPDGVNKKGPKDSLVGISWGGHNAWSPWAALKYYKNIFNCNMVNPAKSFCTWLDYDNVDGLWGPIEANSSEDNLWGWLRKTYLKMFKEQEVDTSQFVGIHPWIDIHNKVKELEQKETQSIPLECMVEISKVLEEKFRKG